MAQGSTVYNFEVSLSDTTRGVYESFSVRAARHPSESADYLLCRVLAYCLEYEEGLELTKGLDDPDVPALWTRDLTGALVHWIEIGTPSAEKLHRASKAVDRVSVYTYKNPQNLLQQLAGARVHRADRIRLHSIAPEFLSELGTIVERRNTWELSVNEGELYLTQGERTLHTTLTTHPLG